MLLNGKVDVAFFVSTHLAAHVIQLIDSKSVELMGPSGLKHTPCFTTTCTF